MKRTVYESDVGNLHRASLRALIHETNCIWSCHLHRIFLCALIQEMNHIWKCCNLRCIFLREIIHETNHTWKCLHVHHICCGNSVYFVVSSEFFCSFSGMGPWEETYVGDSLVWGSLRLAPLIIMITKYVIVIITLSILLLYNRDHWLSAVALFKMAESCCYDNDIMCLLQQ